MGREDTAAVAARYARDAWDPANPFDPSVLEGLLSEDFRRHLSAAAAPLDRAQQMERLLGIRAAFTELSIEPDDVVVDGDRAVIRATITGTHSGELMGIAPTGKRVTVRLIDMMRVTDGVIVEQWGGPDMLDLLQQIGAEIRPQR